jgi:hypothetical protein
MRRLLVVAIVLFGLLGILAGASQHVLAQSYGPDVTASGYATSCGDIGGGGAPASNAFDNNLTTLWQSSQSAAGVSGVACIGQDFGAGNDQQIRQVSIKQQGAVTNSITSVTVQNSSNGSSWNSVSTFAPTINSVIQYFAVPASGAYRYWRLLAAASPTTSNWAIYEIEMMPLVSWPTDTPGPSQTPTITLTPSTTPSPTPNYYVEVTSTAGAPMRFEMSATAGDAILFSGLLALFALGFIGLALIYWMTKAK